MSLLVRIDGEIERQSLLKHPFYRSWSEGGLTRENLAGYSMEYFQLVKAVPGMVSNIASLAPAGRENAISMNLEEERTHIQPWIRFAGSLGVTQKTLDTYRGADATVASVRAMNLLTTSSFEEGVAAMYAYEKQLPKISRSKIDGLKRFYGLDSKDATEYFELHEEADVRHAALWASYIARSMHNEDAIVSAVRGSLRAQNALLDSVMANHC